MAQAETEHTVLLGMIAYENDLVSREALEAGVESWVGDKTRPLGEILQSQGALDEKQRTLLEGLVDERLKKHDKDVSKTVRAMTDASFVAEKLGELSDPELASSITRVITGSKVLVVKDSPPAAGASTSSGKRFHILRPHAKGGLGQVYVAMDSELNREVALKEIQTAHADDVANRSRFVLEAEITGGLEHPGIVPVYGIGTYADGRPFYAMRFIRGVSLMYAIDQAHSARRANPVQAPPLAAGDLRKLLRRLIDVCNALQYAHDRGVLHRDLKPSNIMLGKYGETLLVDWGLAKPLGKTDQPAIERPLMPTAATDSSATLDGYAIGTPAFMSPEQAAGHIDEITTASDVYGLGATMYCVLTGNPPIQGQDVQQILQNARRGRYVAPRRIQPALAPALEAICLKAMSLKPADRYGSPRLVAEDIERWLADEPVQAWPEPLTVRARRWIANHRTLVTASAATMLVAAVSLAAATVLLTSANERTRLANQSLTQANDEIQKSNDEIKKSSAEIKRAYEEITRANEKLAREKQKAEDERARAERSEKKALEQGNFLVGRVYADIALYGEMASKSRKHWEKLKVDADKAAELAPNNSSSYQLQAVIAIRQARLETVLDKQIETLGAANQALLKVRKLERDKNWPSILLLHSMNSLELGNCLLQKSNQGSKDDSWRQHFREATYYAEELAAKYPEFEPATVQLALGHAREDLAYYVHEDVEQNYQKAEQAFILATNDYGYPEPWADPWVALGRIRYRWAMERKGDKGLMDRGLEALVKAFTMRPSLTALTEACYWQGLLLKKSDAEKAAAAFAQAERKGGDSAFAYLAAGELDHLTDTLLAEAGALDKAKPAHVLAKAKIIERCLKSFPSFESVPRKDMLARWGLLVHDALDNQRQLTRASDEDIVKDALPNLAKRDARHTTPNQVRLLLKHVYFQLKNKDRFKLTSEETEKFVRYADFAVTCCQKGLGESTLLKDDLNNLTADAHWMAAIARLDGTADPHEHLDAVANIRKAVHVGERHPDRLIFHARLGIELFKLMADADAQTRARYRKEAIATLTPVLQDSPAEARANIEALIKKISEYP